MPKATKGIKHNQHDIEKNDNNQAQVISDPEESSSSEQEIFFQPQPQPSSTQVTLSMFMPYIEGPKMD